MSRLPHASMTCSDGCASLTARAVPRLGLVKLMWWRARERAAAQLVELGLPGMPNTVQCGSVVDVAWYEPNAWLLMGEEEAVAARAAELVERSDRKAAMVSLTDARQVFELCGDQAVEALASLVPVDIGSSAFGVGRCARTHLGEIPVFIQQTRVEPGYRLIVDRPHAGYAWRMIAGTAGAVSKP